jgi:FtsH-binding integral membrane protein
MGDAGTAFSPSSRREDLLTMAFGPDNRFQTSGSAWTQPFGRTTAVDAAQIDAGLRSYMLRVYNWMASGLLLTGIVAYLIANTGAAELFYQVVRTPRGNAVSPTILGWIAMFSPLVFVLVLSFGINRMSKTTAQALFWAFAGVMGASMANIFAIYTSTSIASTFFITAGMFAATSLYGYTTKADLTKLGTFMMMGLIGIIIAGIVNMFVGSSALQFAISVLGVVIFVGLTAYDTQRIKADYVQYAYAEGSDEAGKRSVFDALGLYLNFINLFQFLLQFMGVRQNSN